MSLAFIPGVDEYGYSFAGAKTLIRPQVDSANLHYIAVPPELTAPEDAFPLSPALFSAVVEIATQTCLRKMGIASAQQGSPPAG